MTTKNPIKDATNRETSILLKKYLKEHFKLTASVKTSFASMMSSLYVQYDLGCGEGVVYKSLSRLEKGSYNSLQDQYEHKHPSELGLIYNNKRLYSYRFIEIRQMIPESIYFHIARFMTKSGTYQGSHQVLQKADMTKMFEAGQIYGCWNWSELSEILFRTRNFITQDIQKIIFHDCVQIPNSWSVALIYEYEGNYYRTDDEPILNHSAQKPLSRAIQNKIQILDYSDKSIVVIGETYEIREQLAAAHGKYNKFLKIDGRSVAGWLFSKKRESLVADIIINYSNSK